MKFVAIFVSAILISGCSIFEPKIEYRDRIVYQEPVYDVPPTRRAPKRPDYLDEKDIIRYWAQCEATIATQQSDIMGVINSLQTTDKK